MKLFPVKDNTWAVEGQELIPLYKLDDRRCILLDTGLLGEREELEQTLLSAGLTPAGILCSHAHLDHCANNGYFQEKYRIPVALTAPEAGMCASLLTLKCYFLLLTPDTVEGESACMVHTPDVIVPPTDGPFPFAGAEFQVIHTPGHSAGHISVITPDNVCYAADVLLSREALGAKLPYSLCHKKALASREKLRGLGCDAYVLAHKGVCPPAEFDALIDRNQGLILQRAEEIYSLVTQPMTAGEITAAVCEKYQLFTHHPRRSLRFERNVRFFLDFLVDTGRLELTCRRGVTLYRRPGTCVPEGDVLS